MIDQFIIFTKTGTVLWNKTFSEIQGNPINELIQKVLLEDRTAETQTSIGPYCLKWLFDNNLDLVLVLMYQKILQLSYGDELLKKTLGVRVQWMILDCGLSVDMDTTAISRQV